MKTSYSALDTFKTCQLKYKLQEIDKIKAPKSKEAVFGTIIHNSLKFLHTPRPVSPTIEEVLEYYNNLWNSEVYEDKQEEAAVLSEGVRILQNYYEKNNPKNFNVIDLETRFSLNIKEDLTLSGTIDRIDKLDDDSFEVIDYKTAKKLPAQQEVDNDFQLSIYHMAILNRWPKIDKPIKLSLYFLKHGIKLSTFRTPEEIEKTKLNILKIVEEISKSNFPPMPSALCDWCGYQQYCPMFKHKFKKEEKAEDIDIQAVLKEYYELKVIDKKNSERIAELQKIINKYCDSQNIERVFGDGIYITRTIQQRYSYDIEKIKNILQPLGKWDEVVSIDSTKLKNVISTLPDKEKKKIENARELKKEFKSLSLKKERKSI
jgi:RecB family exonuclease